MKHLLSIIFIMIFYQANAQNNTPFKRLYIGDTVPMESIVFDNVRNYPGGKAKLSEFKGKYIILDFWTKGCTVCIRAFPKMEELQNQFKDNIQILLVTKDKEEKLAHLLKNSTNIKNSKLPMIIGDEVLATKLFPHGGVPYHVWLDREGKVVATTYGEDTNAKNLSAFIEGKPLNLVMRNEIVSHDDPFVKEIKDHSLSLLKVDNGRLLNHVKYYAQIPSASFLNNSPKTNSVMPSNSYYSMFMGYVPGDVKMQDKYFQDTTGKAKGYRIYNWLLESLYREAYLSLLDNQGVPSQIGVAKIIKEGHAKIIDPDIVDSISEMQYQVNHQFSYESVLPEYSFEAAQNLLRQDLARVFGMAAKIEDRPLECYILRRLGTTEEKNLWAKKQNLSRKQKDVLNVEPRFTKEGYLHLQQNRVFDIKNFLVSNNNDEDAPLFLDETDFNSEEKDRRIDVVLECKSLKVNAENIKSIQRALAKYGLGLTKETRKLKVLVLKGAL